MSESASEAGMEGNQPGRPPVQVGAYVVDGLLGSGGMGDVYRAHHQDDDRVCALKIIRVAEGTDSERIRRFENEVAAVQRLHHPGIVRVIESGKDGPHYYLAMELVEGRTLESWLVEQERAMEARIAMIRAIAEAVEHAHRAGLIHRDIKPANVIIRSDDDQPVVADFGLARAIGSESSLTRSEEAVGTPAYMAPEQARGEHRRCDARTDVWALGVLLYQATVGVRPFQGESSLDIMAAIVNRDPPPPRHINPTITPHLERVVMQALRKSMGQRYPSAGAFAEDLGRVLAGRSVSARPFGLFQRHHSLLKRIALPATLGLLSMVATAILVVYLVQTEARRIGAWHTLWTWQRGEAIATGDLVQVRGQWGEGSVLTPDPDGLIRPTRNHLVWIDPVAERGGVRLRVRLRWPEEVDGVELHLHADRAHAANWVAMPSGYGSQVGGYSNRYHLISINHQPQIPDWEHVRPSDLDAGRWYDLAFTFVDGRVDLSIDDEVVLSRPELLPVGGVANRSVGLRAWTGIEIAEIKVERRALPLSASPLVAADALYRYGREVEARGEYLAMAEDYRDTPIGITALGRATVLAFDAGEEALGNRLLADLRRRDQGTPFLQAGVERRALMHFRNGAHEDLIEDLRILRGRWPTSHVPAAIIHGQRQTMIPGDLVVPLLEGIAVNPNRVALHMPGTGVESLAPLEGAALVNLAITDADLGDPGDLDALSDMPLRNLRLIASGCVALPPFRRARLEVVEVSHSPLADLSPLAGMPVSQAAVNNTEVADLAPVANERLRSVDVASTRVADLTCLQGLPLTSLDISNTEVADLTPLRQAALQDLVARQSGIRDLEPLAGMPLERVNLKETGVVDLTPVIGDELRNLDVSWTPISDLSIIAEAPGLDHLVAAGLEEVRLPPQGHPTVGRMDLKRSDYEGPPHGDWPSLWMLSMSGNPISDEADFSRFVNLRRLVLQDCGLTAVPRLPPGVEFLDLSGANPLERVDALLALERPPPALSLPWQVMELHLFDRLIEAWSDLPDSEGLMTRLRAQRALASGDRDAILRAGVAFEGRGYIGASAEMTWSQAKAYADRYDLRLLTLREGIGQALHHFLEEGSMWLGATQRAGDWVWDDGRPVPAWRVRGWHHIGPKRDLERNRLSGLLMNRLFRDCWPTHPSIRHDLILEWDLPEEPPDPEAP